MRTKLSLIWWWIVGEKWRVPKSKWNENRQQKRNRILSLFSLCFSLLLFSLSTFPWSLHLPIPIPHSRSRLSATHKYKCTIPYSSSSSSLLSPLFSSSLSLSSSASQQKENTKTILKKCPACWKRNTDPRRRGRNLRRREPKLTTPPIRVRGSDSNPLVSIRLRLPVALCRERSNSSMMTSSNATTWRNSHCRRFFSSHIWILCLLPVWYTSLFFSLIYYPFLFNIEICAF